MTTNPLYAILGIVAGLGCIALGAFAPLDETTKSTLITGGLALFGTCAGWLAPRPQEMAARKGKFNSSYSNQTNVGIVLLAGLPLMLACGVSFSDIVKKTVDIGAKIVEVVTGAEDFLETVMPADEFAEAQSIAAKIKRLVVGIEDVVSSEELATLLNRIRDEYDKLLAVGRPYGLVAADQQLLLGASEKARLVVPSTYGLIPPDAGK